MAYIVVLVTTKNNSEARKIAKALVQRELAACCNIVPSVRSIYRWQGRVCDEKESLMIIKTRRASFSALEKAVKALHSYSTPEIIALPITAGNKQYLKWLDDAVGSR